MNDAPFVLCLTNTVAANFTANCLLAVGAKPAMVEDRAEAEELAAAADAMLVNVGTINAAQADVMRGGIAAANAAHTPWLLDPVAVQVLAYRRGIVREFLQAHPTLVRGNRAEMDFLLANEREALAATPWFATGATDEVSDGHTFTGGVPMLQLVTATGCAQGAIAASMLGRGLSPLEAAEKSCVLMKRAGERAWEKAKTPGSFMVALVDALYELTH